MQAKLDENLGQRGQRVLRDAGWDVATVVGQHLCGAADTALIDVCRAEGRVLVTFDKDFAHTLRFPPARYPGIVVLRLAEPIDPERIDDALRRVAAAAQVRSPAGALWIVDEKRIREFRAPDPA